MPKATEGSEEICACPVTLKHLNRNDDVVLRTALRRFEWVQKACRSVQLSAGALDLMPSIAQE
jgi:hypothetical protein